MHTCVCLSGTLFIFVTVSIREQKVVVNKVVFLSKCLLNVIMQCFVIKLDNEGNPSCCDAHMKP